MVPPKLSFWSISRKESLDSQEKHADKKRSLRLLLCSNDNFDSGYNRKMLIRKRTSLLDGVCLNFEQLFDPVQCTACRIYQCRSRDKLVLPRVTRILSISEKFHLP